MQSTLRAPGRLRGRTRALRHNTVLVTGCNTGIGRELARQVLSAGGNLVFTCRTVAKVRATLAELLDEFPLAEVRGHALELTDLASVDALAEELARNRVSIETLILNAGVHMPFRRLLTADGRELHHQVNFVAPARLFLRLAGAPSPPSRVLYVSSNAHQRGHLPTVFPISFWSRYARSKLEATAFFHAARPLFPGTSISVLSPGDVATEVHRHKRGVVRALRRLGGRARPVGVAARELLDVLFRRRAPEAYRNRGRIVPVSPRALDPDLHIEVWKQVCDGWAGAAGLPAPDRVLVNHAGTVTALAPEIHAPHSDVELADIVRTAAREGRQVRVVGSRHSYNDCFYSPSTLVSLERFDEIGEIDQRNHTVTVGAGVKLQRLCDHLEARGYALRWAGNSGKQTLVGAALTGTHGFAREGGLLAELIVGARVVTGRGAILTVRDEFELRALRVSLGTLALVTQVTMSLVPAGEPVRYTLRTYDEPDFLDRLCDFARGHAYFRFFPNRYHPERFSVLTIDPADEPPTPAELGRLAYIDRTVGPRWLVRGLRTLLRSSLAHRLLRMLPAPRLGMSLVAPFSTLLFVNAGVVNRLHRLCGLAYQAWNDDRTHNMELAIRPEDFRTFLGVFRRLESRYRRRTGDFGTYFTGRYVGGSERTLLGPNHGRDVVFVDLHVTQGPHARPFLQELERAVTVRMPIRPHWGKEFVRDGRDLLDAYPAEAWAAFRAAKRRYDPDNVFSNAYTKRVFGW